MVLRVWDRVKGLVDDVGPAWVATDDREQLFRLKEEGGNCILTGPAETGSDRCALALPEIERMYGYDFDAVINVQGDIPFVPPSLPRLVAAVLRETKFDVVTPVCERSLVTACQWSDPDFYHVDFSRSKVKEHIGVYGFQRAALMKFHSWLPSERELATHLELNRGGLNVELVNWPYMPIEINTKEDALRLEDMMKDLEHALRQGMGRNKTHTAKASNRTARASR